MSEDQSFEERHLTVSCVWEHNGNDTLLHAAELPGAYGRGASIEEAKHKLKNDVKSYLLWLECDTPREIDVDIVQDYPCDLAVFDADSDVIFYNEKAPLTEKEYFELKALALKSARDFYELYKSIPNKEGRISPERKTFYGTVPRTASEMYEHTKNVNEYYFAEVGVVADNGGEIFECRSRGFKVLEAKPDFLKNEIFEGSYGELWSLRKMLRRFVWHDRIHAKAMYRLGFRLYGKDNVKNIFRFNLA